MALASLILIALAASVLVVTSAASNTKTTSSGSKGLSTRQKCIKVQKCPKNEEFSICIQSLGRAQFCFQRGQTLRETQDEPNCTEGCVCKDKFLRNYNGTCIPESECSTECGPDEVQDDCPVDCASDYCPTTDERSLSCPRPESDECPPPVCKCGFNRRRAENGTCILTRDCPPVDCSARPFEEYVACPPLCPTDDCSQASENGECPRQFGNILIILPCNPTCRCIQGYWRKNGICVPYDECNIPTSCPANEEVSCVNECPPETTCKTRGIEYDCLPPDRPCQHKCVCKEGFFRNFLGTCISNEQCDNCTGDNEFFACDSFCDNECSKIQKQNRTNCPIKTFVCVSQCFCEDGFARDKDGKCVPVEKCPKPMTCPANEEVRCVNKCPPELTCKTRGRIYKCAAPVDPCENKCVCKKGYYRNSLGTCIPEDECDIPTSCPANEEVRCVDECHPEKTCKTRGIEYDCMPPVHPCQHKCVCKKGYYRNFLGTCISNKQCDKCTGDNEFFACDSFCDNECSTIQTQNRTNCPVKPIVCVSQCFCEDGFARDKDGNCVPVEECHTPTSCLANEEIRCVNKCPPERTCKTRNLQYKCMAPVDPCQNKCVCKEGYFRNFLGTCISDAQCDKCTRDNEFFACDSFCDNVCSNIREQNRTNCPIATLQCVSQCFCKDGFARDKDKNCVPVEECPVNTCPANEEYVPCIQGVCRAMNCSQKGESVPCPDRQWPEEKCDAGCICKENYLRNEEGTCVPEDQCETEPEPTCGENEILDDCPTDCRSDYCPKSEKDNKRCPQPDTCPPPQCKCGFNFRRSKNGTCIPTEDCPPFDCKKPNEEWTPCPPYCPTDDCSINRVKGTCPFKILIRLECNPKCQCKDGYGRVNGTCVPFEDCPDLCPSNEEYSSCTQAVCRPQKCTNRYEPQPCPRIESSACKRGCVCKQDYFRNDNGTCVTDDECVDKQCPNPNEKYALSQQPKCPALGTCMSIVARIPCDKPESLGCICKSGYMRDDDTSVCIRICDCPQMSSALECKKKIPHK